jgi:hypothetical protein
MIICSPCILSTNLLFLSFSEVSLDLEKSADLFWRFALNHVCYSLAPDIKKLLNIEVVGSLL